MVPAQAGGVENARWMSCRGHRRRSERKKHARALVQQAVAVAFAVASTGPARRRCRLGPRCEKLVRRCVWRRVRRMPRMARCAPAARLGRELGDQCRREHSDGAGALPGAVRRPRVLVWGRGGDDHRRWRADAPPRLQGLGALLVEGDTRRQQGRERRCPRPGVSAGTTAGGVAGRLERRRARWRANTSGSLSGWSTEHEQRPQWRDPAPGVAGEPFADVWGRGWTRPASGVRDAAGGS